MIRVDAVDLLNRADVCPVCDSVLSDDEVSGFPCDSCTESQPMDVWVSHW